MKSRLVIVFIHLMSLLPLRVARGLGIVAGDVCWLSRSRMATTTAINLALCFPHLDSDARRTLARKSLRNTCMTICEAGATWLWPVQRTLQLIQHVDGLDVLQDAHKHGRGVLVLSPHIGNWEIVGLLLDASGCGQTNQLYQAPDDARLGQLVLQARGRNGARLVATDSKGVGTLLQALRRGELVGILPDQVPPNNGGDFAPFFGVPALTMTLVCRLQQKTSAKIVMCAVRRTAGGFHIRFQPPPQEIYAEHMPTALATMNQAMEAQIREAPEQYQWEYKRFKRQPDGRARPY